MKNEKNAATNSKSDTTKDAKSIAATVNNSNSKVSNAHSTDYDAGNATSRTRARSGSGLNNEGTTVSYDDERRNG